MDGLGECGCSGVAGNHFQIAIVPYFGFAIGPWIVNQTNRCEIPLYLRRDVIMTERRQYQSSDGSEVYDTTITTHLHQLMDRWTGAITEFQDTTTGVFPNSPTPPAGIPWLPQSQSWDGTKTSRTTQKYTSNMGFYQNSYSQNGVYFPGANYLRTVIVEETLSLPNDLNDWKNNVCEGLKWCPSIEDIRERVAEHPDYSATIYTYNGTTVNRVDIYGVDSIYDTGHLDTSGIRLAWDDPANPAIQWMSADLKSEVVAWMWVGNSNVGSRLRHVHRGLAGGYNNRLDNRANFKYNPVRLAGEGVYTDFALFGFSFEASCGLSMLETSYNAPGFNPNHYLFTQSLLTGACEGISTDTEHNFYVPAGGIEMILDMNETSSDAMDASLYTDPDRKDRGIQQVAWIFGPI